jgi:hypothetical protein
MRDEDFVEFINEFGEPTHRTTVPAESIERWRGRLPDQLLTYWQQEGWCGYANGLIWTVDPDDYEDLIDEWLEDTPLERLDSFHVIARTAFGKLFTCGEKVGPVLDIASLTHSLFALAKDLRSKSPADLDFEVRGFFAGTTRRGCDLIANDKTALFEPALKKLGPLAPDEMYALEPALAVGGSIALEHLVRVKLDPHLTILRQLAAPTMPYAHIDIDKLMQA